MRLQNLTLFSPLPPPLLDDFHHCHTESQPKQPWMMVRQLHKRLSVAGTVEKTNVVLFFFSIIYQDSKSKTMELQTKFTELASLFSVSIREVAEKVAKAVNKKEQELSGSQSNGSGSSSSSGATGSAATNVEYKAIKDGADTLAKNVNDKLLEIEQVVAELPGTDKTIQQLLNEIEEAEEKNKQAGELLDVAQEEAKKWLSFVDESNKRLASKNLERLSDSNSGNRNKRQKR